MTGRGGRRSRESGQRAARDTGSRPREDPTSGWAVHWKAQRPAVSSGGEWAGAQPCQSPAELIFPRVAPGEIPGDTPRQGDQTRPESLGCCLCPSARPLRIDASCTASQVTGHDPRRQPSSIGGEASRGETAGTHALLQIPDGLLELDVAALISQFRDIPSRPVMRARQQYLANSSR